MERLMKTPSAQVDGMTLEHPRFGQLYTTAEVAKLLRVDQTTVQGWLRDGLLPGIRLGRLWRVRHADLETFGDVVNKRHGN